MQKITPLDIKPASYNPRVFSDKKKESLHYSMEEFDDISGITFNKTTGNLVTGHHRWEQICRRYGVQNIDLKQINDTDRYFITDLSGNDLGFIIRFVEWDIEKEKLANITANSPTVSGVFSDKLQGILSTTKKEFGINFDKLQLNSLMDIKVKSPKQKKEKKNLKSETIINAGGDTYRTVKLELTPELADRLHDTLDKFRSNGSVEKPLKLLLDYIDLASKEEIIDAVNDSSKRIRRKKTIN